MRTSLPKKVAVIHLPALLGAPHFSKRGLPANEISKIMKLAVHEAKIFEDLGFDGVILENFGDVPFYAERVGPETLASMSVVAYEVRRAVKCPLGINVLRNDAHAALSIAAVTGAQFIRVNVLSGVAATDQGIIQGCASGLLRERARLNVEHIQILADAEVKHARSLSSDNLTTAIEEISGRGGANAVIITGATTGRSPSLDKINEGIRATSAHHLPLYLGSGVNPEFLDSIKSKASFYRGKFNVIVGSTLRSQGKAGAPLELKRARNFLKAWKLLD